MGCKHELNSQIKGLQARISQAENDINAHYAGISQLAIALAANPFTAASAAATAAIYNLNPVGMKLLRSLLNALIPKELLRFMRLITMLEAAKLDDLAENIMDAAAAQALGMVNSGIDQITATALSELAAIQAELNSLNPSNIATALENLTESFAISNDRIYQQTVMDTAFNAWNDAVNAPIGTYTQEAINELRKEYLKAKQVIALMDAGIASAFQDVSGILNGISGTTQEINTALAQVNSVLAFITTQDDISSCKSVAMRIGP